MFSRLKSLPLTIALTVLIWIYAEAQFTATRDNVRLLVKLVPPSADLTLRPLDPQGSPRSLASVLVTIQGPKDQLDRIYQQAQYAATPEDDLSSLTYAPPLNRLNPGAPLATGDDNTVDTLAMLNSLDYFRRRNVIITTAIPARIKLDVDTLERLTKSIDFRPSIAVAHFSFTPEQVTVTVPSRTLQAIGGIEKLNVVAEPLRDLATLPADAEHTIPVRYRLEYPGTRDERIIVTPVQGSVTLRLPRREGITQLVPDVPVWVAGPPEVLQRYTVDRRPSSVRVTVAGSGPAINALRQRMIPQTPPAGGDPARVATHGIQAYLDLGPADRAGETYTPRRLRYVLPEGLTVQEAPQEAEFRLTERTPATTPAPATTTAP
jgi:hypothetical protein